MVGHSDAILIAFEASKDVATDLERVAGALRAVIFLRLTSVD
jgi:hypothetical protein